MMNKSLCVLAYVVTFIASCAVMSPSMSFANHLHSKPAIKSASVTRAQWEIYKSKFLESDGRIIDDGNGGISHSEGQGYGLLLSYLADEPADFERIWAFTRTELMIRNDGLSAWKWIPTERPHISDPNNATDGDILIAYALALAGEQWQREDYLIVARVIAGTLLKKLVIDHEDKTILLPGIAGFSSKHRENGPVVNLSYWIFEAFPTLNKLAPSPQWDRLAKTGLELVKEARLNSVGLPPDWISLRGEAHPAQDFEPEFGYNGLRIVLYLARAHLTSNPVTASLAGTMTNSSGDVILVNVSTGQISTVLSDPGYKIIPQMVRCVSGGSPLSQDVKSFQPTLYYPSTLHLLALAYLNQNYPECL